MKPITAVSVDDERSAHLALESLAKQLPTLNLMTSYTSPIEALEGLRLKPVELLFLDIAMPQMSGLEFLRQLEHPPVTVLLTAYGEHALDAFQLGVRDYLLKPVSLQRLQQCLDQITPLVEVIRGKQSQIPRQLAIKQGNQSVLFDPHQLPYLEASGNFTTLHLLGRQLFASVSLKTLEARLNPFGFIRVHKSFMVNTSFLMQLQGQQLHLTTGVHIPIGRAYRHQVKELFEANNRSPSP